MERAIYANWQALPKMQQKDLYQAIQDVFAGNYFRPSNLYMPSTVEMPIYQPAGIPSKVSGNVNLNGKRELEDI
jgi:hypothetical protein